MKEADIRKYAGLMEELGLTGLEITEDNRVVRLERSIPAGAKETICVNPVPAAQAAAPIAAEDSFSEYTVKSPMVGIFYAAPAKNGEPYAAIGDSVKKGQTLCIIEAMKLMNEIAAEEDGVIAEICVTDGQAVEYGTPLFRIRRADT